MTEQEYKLQHLALADQVLAGIRQACSEEDLTAAVFMLERMAKSYAKKEDPLKLEELMLLAANAVIVVRAQLQERE